MSVQQTVQPDPAATPRRARRRYPAGLLTAAVLVALVALLPLGFVVGYTADLGLFEAAALIFRPRILELLGNTALLTFATMATTAVIGIGAAWLVERSDLPFRRIWNVLLVAPLAVPAFVNAFAWISLVPSASGFFGALIVVTMSYFPFVYLPVAAALKGLDPALEESAQSLGLSRWRVFVRVVLPQLRPALYGGVLLVGLHILAEFGALSMVQFATFTTAIYDLFQSSFNGPAANMVAGVLALCALALLTMEIRLRGRRRYSRLGSGTARVPVRIPLGGLRLPALAGVAAVVVAGVAVPVGSIVFWLVDGARTTVDLDALVRTTLTAAGLGAAVAAITVVLAIPVAWLYVRYPGRLSSLLERSTYVDNALPGIVIALALVTITLRIVPPLYQTPATLVIAYVIMFLPRAMVNVRAGITQAPPLLDDVAHGLGLSRLQTLRRVVLPLIAPSLGAGAALVFIGVATELTATLLLSPIGTETLATKFWSFSSTLNYGSAAPYAAMMVLISIPATVLLTRSVRREVAQ